MENFSREFIIEFLKWVKTSNAKVVSIDGKTLKETILSPYDFFLNDPDPFEPLINLYILKYYID